MEVQMPEDEWDAILVSSSLPSYIAQRRSFLAWCTGVGEESSKQAPCVRSWPPFKSEYNVSKHALVGLTMIMALELAQMGVTCRLVCSGEPTWSHPQHASFLLILSLSGECLFPLSVLIFAKYQFAWIFRDPYPGKSPVCCEMRPSM